MKGILDGSIFLVAGALAGLASAIAVIEFYSATPVEPGSPWRSWDVSPDSNVRPYALDHFLMAGRFPPAAGQMREFSAHATSEGVLSGTCNYLLTAKQAPSLWWTLAVFSSESSGPAHNTVLTADTAVTESDGSLRVAVSRSPSTGNWIRPPSASGFTILYTIAEPSSDLSRGPPPMFAIERSGC